MIDIYGFIEKISNYDDTLQIMMEYKKYNLKDCRVLLFNEKCSNFKETEENFEYGKYDLVGLADYKKIWIVDEKTVNQTATTIPVERIVNYDLNIVTYMNNLFNSKSNGIPEKDNFYLFLEKIKLSKLTNNISTALWERYNMPVNNKILNEMIKSYVYFDTIDFQDFILEGKYCLTEEKYKWMKEIIDNAENYLSQQEKINHYEAIVCYIIKAFSLKNNKSLSIKKKEEEFKKYCLNVLSVYLDLEFTLLILYLRNENELVNKLFQKLQISANNLIEKIHNVSWDIFHIRLLEQSFLNDLKNHKDRVCLHYFATADVGLKDIIKANPLKMLVYNNKNIIPIRKYDASSFFSESEHKLYFSKKAIEKRKNKIVDQDFSKFKEKLIDNLKIVK